jgi:putative membrane protein
VALEFTLLKQELTLANARRLQATDAVLGVAATLLLFIGLARVFWFEKGASYYFSSHAFLGKLSLFIAVAVLSIIPTIEFLKWRRETRAGQVPVVAASKLRQLRIILHVELTAIVLILLFAAIMAKGGWV